MSTRIVVAGALICDGALLVAQRARPPELAGLWELPGGKVADGEAEADALVRELREELGIEVAVGPRLPGDVALGEAMTLRAYRVSLLGGAASPHEHRALRWVRRDELSGLTWVPADTAWLPQLAALLS
ncbi:(deoxy)nucleoside triphosphate pyrophosphohydrolase [Mycolicibacterium palauense]|uniref:(deoxy)nucleoside triphosphate pyrophosphohydrolase n=1 Tax=Mycolicibacterium palauense TaxID=2034511 RepID=UPI000BFED0AA|nr:(deoxy)nucleoside triphosphate pyrophosphohydrolase [Mycolicibacterium palauense]